MTTLPVLILMQSHSLVAECVHSVWRSLLIATSWDFGPRQYLSLLRRLGAEQISLTNEDHADTTEAPSCSGLIPSRYGQSLAGLCLRLD